MTEKTKFGISKKPSSSIADTGKCAGTGVQQSRFWKEFDNLNRTKAKQQSTFLY